MIFLYTAVGRFERRTTINGQSPVIIVSGKEYMVNMPEMIIWTCLNWRILELPQIETLYKEMTLDTDVNDPTNYEIYLDRLIQRGLVMSGIGVNGIDALYDLLSNLYIVPVISGLFVKVMAFLKFIFVNRLPFSKAKTVFQNEKLSVNEKRIIDLAKQVQLSTSAIIKCVENDGQKSVLETVANLYLKKLIIFERI